MIDMSRMKAEGDDGGKYGVDGRVRIALCDDQ